MTKLISVAAVAVTFAVLSVGGGAAFAQTTKIEARLLDSYAQGTMRDLADRRMARKEGMKRGGGMHRGPHGGGMMKRGMHRGQRHHVN